MTNCSQRPKFGSIIPAPFMTLDRVPPLGSRSPSRVCPCLPLGKQSSNLIGDTKTKRAAEVKTMFSAINTLYDEYEGSTTLMLKKQLEFHPSDGMSVILIFTPALILMDSAPILHLGVSYIAKSWAFLRRGDLTFLADAGRLKLQGQEILTETHPGGVSEMINYAISPEQLEALSQSKQLKVRVAGRDTFFDFKMKRGHIKQLRTFYDEAVVPNLSHFTRPQPENIQTSAPTPASQSEAPPQHAAPRTKEAQPDRKTPEPASQPAPAPQAAAAPAGDAVRDEQWKHRECPECAEDIKAKAKRCRYCSHQLEDHAEWMAYRSAVEAAAEALGEHPMDVHSKASDIAQLAPDGDMAAGVEKWLETKRAELEAAAKAKAAKRAARKKAAADEKAAKKAAAEKKTAAEPKKSKQQELFQKVMKSDSVSTSYDEDTLMRLSRKQLLQVLKKNNYSIDPSMDKHLMVDLLLGYDVDLAQGNVVWYDMQTWSFAGKVKFFFFVIALAAIWNAIKSMV